MGCHLGRTANKAEARAFLVFPGILIEFESASKYFKQVAKHDPTGKKSMLLGIMLLFHKASLISIHDS